MILKIREREDGWFIRDEFDKILYYPVDNQCGYSEVLDLREQQRKVMVDAPAQDGIEIELYKDCVFLERIISYKPIYILNDEGKTIERI